MVQLVGNTVCIWPCRMTVRFTLCNVINKYTVQSQSFAHNLLLGIGFHIAHCPSCGGGLWDKLKGSQCTVLYCYTYLNAINSIHCILCNVLYALCSIHCILHIVFYVLYCKHSILCFCQAQPKPQLN